MQNIRKNTFKIGNNKSKEQIIKKKKSFIVPIINDLHTSSSSLSVALGTADVKPAFRLVAAMV